MEKTGGEREERGAKSWRRGGGERGR